MKKKPDRQQRLSEITLAPFIELVTPLKRINRHIGGNAFRHAMSTLAILLDYGHIISDLLKASIAHDFLEDVPKARAEDIKVIDSEGPKVASLVEEVTIRTDQKTGKREPKEMYLERLLKSGSRKAKLIKCADRISNLIDMNLDSFPRTKISDYIDQTEKYVVPMAYQVDRRMAVELQELILRKRKLISGRIL